MDAYKLSTTAGLLALLVSANAQADAENDRPDRGDRAAPEEADVGQVEKEREPEGTVSSEADPDAAPKLWRVNAIISQYVTAGSFVADEFARTPGYGYAVSLRGTYKVTDLVSARARIDFDQQLTTTSIDLPTIPRQFFFRDVRLEALASKLYEEEITGVRVGAGSSLRLPTSPPSIAAERIFGWVNSLSLAKTFKGIGPGDLSIDYLFGFRFNVGPRSPTISPDEALSIFNRCPARSRDPEGATCLTSLANQSHSFSNSLQISYTFLEDFSVSAYLGITNSFSWDLRNPEITEINGNRISRSQFAVDQTGRLDLVAGQLELAYTINDYVSVAFGTLTESDPFIQIGNDPTVVRFPFWDFQSTATNRSQIFLDVSLTY